MNMSYISDLFRQTSIKLPPVAQAQQESKRVVPPEGKTLIWEDGVSMVLCSILPPESALKLNIIGEARVQNANVLFTLLTKAMQSLCPSYPLVCVAPDRN